jgi:hypothetical protein
VGYLALLEAMRAGRLHRTMSWSLERLYRQPRELEDLIDLADPAINGVTVEMVLLSGDIELSTPRADSWPVCWSTRRPWRATRPPGG